MEGEGYGLVATVALFGLCSVSVSVLIEVNVTESAVAGRMVVVALSLREKDR